MAWMFPVLLLMVLAAVGCDNPHDLPAGGVAITPPMSAKSVRFVAKETATIPTTIEYVDIAGQSFESAARVTVNAAGEALDAQLLLKTHQPLKKDQVCLLTFWIRTDRAVDETGQGRVYVFFQKSSPDWVKSEQRMVDAGSTWTRIDLPFRAAEDYDAGAAEVGFGLGVRQQTVEIAGVSVTRFPDGVKISDLPATKRTYAGREPEAAWRKAAQERIEKYRMGNLVVRVVGADGNPVSGAEVRVQQTRHAFGFGTAAPARLLMADDQTGQEFRRHLLELFNRVTLENDLKWAPWEGQWGAKYSRKQTMAALRWLVEQRMTVHGHVMVWPSWKNSPKSLAELKDEPAELRRKIEEHIRDQVQQAGPFITDWDVLNEPYDNHDLMDLLGPEVMVDWFRTARAANKDIKLMINDYAILTTGGEVDTAHQRHYDQTIQFLIDRNAPLDGIGFQGHLGSSVTPPDQLLKIIDRFARFGKRLHVTEFDIDTIDEQLQADYTRDFMTIIFSREEFDAFTMWGCWEGAHWKPTGAMFTRDWRPKPNALAYRDLVFKKWWTDATIHTDAAGTIAQRGFCGEYKVTVTADGRTKAVDAVLNRDGATVTVKLD